MESGVQARAICCLLVDEPVIRLPRQSRRKTGEDMFNVEQVWAKWNKSLLELLPGVFAAAA
jgi:hypothetical protein